MNIQLKKLAIIISYVHIIWLLVVPIIASILQGKKEYPDAYHGLNLVSEIFFGIYFFGFIVLKSPILKDIKSALTLFLFVPAVTFGLLAITNASLLNMFIYTYLIDGCTFVTFMVVYLPLSIKKSLTHTLNFKDKIGLFTLLLFYIGWVLNGFYQTLNLAYIKEVVSEWWEIIMISLVIIAAVLSNVKIMRKFEQLSNEEHRNTSDYKYLLFIKIALWLLAFSCWMIRHRLGLFE